MASSSVKMRINRKAVNELLYGRQGPVVLQQQNVAQAAAGSVRRLAPRSPDPKNRRGPGGRTHLADKIIVKGPVGSMARRNVATLVTADVPWAIYVHRGTNPHPIGSPVFIGGEVGWRYIGLSPAGRGTIHPGTPANRFMIEGFEVLGLRVVEIR